jgi:hypothetical protein
MNEIVLPQELLGPVDTTRPMVIKLPDGRVLGTLGPLFTAEQIAQMKAKADAGPWYSGDQLQARLKALDAEWARTGGFDQEYMRTFLAKLSESDPATFGPTR